MSAFYPFRGGGSPKADVVHFFDRFSYMMASLSLISSKTLCFLLFQFPVNCDFQGFCPGCTSSSCRSCNKDDICAAVSNISHSQNLKMSRGNSILLFTKFKSPTFSRWERQAAQWPALPCWRQKIHSQKMNVKGFAQVSNYVDDDEIFTILSRGWGSPSLDLLRLHQSRGQVGS